MNLYENYKHDDFCRDAMFVQDAVNLRAIARLLVAAADYAADNLGGTQASYEYAPVVMIVDKLQSLCHSDRQEIYSRAYHECRGVVDAATENAAAKEVQS